MRNNEDIISEIKDRLDIVDVVSDQVVLKKSGRNYWGLCPFHKEKSPSFSVNAEKGIYKCFGCGEGGDALSFLMKTQNMSFQEVLVEQAQKLGLEIPNFGQASQKSDTKQKIYDLNSESAKYFTDLLFNSAEAEKARKYLTSRGITEEVIKKYKIGFASKQTNALYSYLIKEFKATNELLNEAGLVSLSEQHNKYYDRFRNRIIIPIQDEKGNIVGFGARALDDNQNPKYLNSPDSPVYNKSRVMYGLYQAKEAIKKEDSVIIMEGYFDVISAQTNGIENVVASSGTSLTEQHIKLLAKYTDSRKIYLAFDSDAAGRNATDRGAGIIYNLFNNLGELKQFDKNFISSTEANNRNTCEIRIINTSIGKDPDEFIKSEGAEAYKKYVKQAPLLIDYQINRIIDLKGKLKTPQDKVEVTRELIPILTSIRDNIYRSEYIQLISERLKINPNALQQEVNSVIRRDNGSKKQIQRIVTKSQKKHVFAQKNLLSIYFISSEKINPLTLNEYLKDISFTETELIGIKDIIEEIITKNDDIENLADKVMSALEDKEEAKKVLADIIFSIDDKQNMDSSLLKQYITENIECLRLYHNQEIQNQLKKQYHEAGDDELGALQLQYKVREQIELNKRYRLEIVNE